MTMMVTIHFHDPREGVLKERAIRGLEVPADKLTVGDLAERLKETEEHLSRLTGLGVRIEAETT